MSEIWNVPSRSSNCNISMLTEKIRPSFVLFLTTIFSTSNVHITIPVNGIIRITFSMHSVVNCLSPFTVSQMPQPPITLDNGFIHRFRFNNVRNSIIEVTNANVNSFRNLLSFLNSCHHATIALFHPCRHWSGDKHISRKTWRRTREAMRSRTAGRGLSGCW